MDDDVSRETPSAPPVARRVFRSERLPLAQRYAGLLATDGVVRGLIGPREAPRLWERHLLNCAVARGADPRGRDRLRHRLRCRAPRAGPGHRPAGPADHAGRAAAAPHHLPGRGGGELGLDRVEVVRGRAEALHGERRFDVVTSRAVAPLERLLGWSMPLVAPTGALVAMKGSSVHEEIAEAAPALRRLGCADPTVTVLGEDLLESTTVALRVAWADPARVSWPLAATPASRSGLVLAASAPDERARLDRKAWGKRDRGSPTGRPNPPGVAHRPGAGVFHRPGLAP